MQALGNSSVFKIALAGEGRTCDAVDVGAFDAEVAKFAVRHAAQLGDRLTILAPVVDGACYVHLIPLSMGFRSLAASPWRLVSLR